MLTGLLSEISRDRTGCQSDWNKDTAEQKKQKALHANPSLTAAGLCPYGLLRVKTKIFLALFVGLAVGLVMGIIVGAGAAWMLAAHLNGKVSTSQPLTGEVDQADLDRNTPWTSSQGAAADSVEGQLRSQGSRWVQTPGEINVGAYVQDILEGRLDQPKGRGAIGKIVSISTGNDDVPGAVVDFGRGYSVGINLSELRLVSVVSEDK
jgi:hypothetical protein